MDETPETECRQCDGQGFIRTNEWPFGPTCPACNGMGYRPLTADDAADAAEEQHRLICEGEPQLSMQEEIGSASCRERWWQDVWFKVGEVYFKEKKASKKR